MMEQNKEAVPQPYTDDNAKNDLAKVVAQFTSGVTDAIPEQEDLETAWRLLMVLKLMLLEGEE